MDPTIPILSDTTEWVDQNGNPTGPPQPGLPLLGWGATTPTKVRRLVLANGEVWVSVNDGPLSYAKTDPQLAATWRAEQKSEAEPKAPTVREFPDGTLREYNAKTGAWEVLAREPEPPPQTVTRGNTVYRVEPDGTWTPIQELPAVPQQAPQRAPRYPEEAELDRLRVEQARRELMPATLLALQQRQEVIGAIRDRLARGELTVAEADRLMNLASANMDAALQGTTPWQMEQAKQAAERERQGMAQRFLEERARASGSLASNLLSGLASVYGRIYAGANPPTAFNPLAMASAFTDETGGGGELAQLARALLASGLRP